MVLGKLPVPGRPTIWITVGQGPTVLAVGAGGGCLDIFTLIYPFSPLSPSLWETARYRLKHCLKGPLTPNQSTNKLKNEFETTVVNEPSVFEPLKFYCACIRQYRKKVQACFMIARVNSLPDDKQKFVFTSVSESPPQEHKPDSTERCEQIKPILSSFFCTKLEIDMQVPECIVRS